MSNYVQQSLIAGEEVIYSAKISLFAFWKEYLITVVLIYCSVTLSLLISIIALIPLLLAYLQYTTTDLAFTNKRLVAKFGILKKETVELQIQRIGSLRVSQGFIGGIFNYGSIVVTGFDNAPIPNISKPMEFRKAFAEYQDKIGN